ncbi:unnamed protein product [Brassica oleracea]
MSGEEEQNAAKLKIGDEFLKAKCLMNCEVSLILEHKYEQLQQVSEDPMNQVSQVIEKSLQYVKRFSRYKNPYAVRQVREYHLSFHRILSRHQLTEFELCVLGNLCLETAKEAVAIVPSLKVSMKTQLVSQEELIEMQQQKTSQETVRDILAHHSRRNPYKIMEMCNMVGIDDAILYSLPSQLTKSGIQKVKIAAALLKEADAYVLDEPSSYLSRKERLRVAHAIVSVIGPNKYVVVADEDVKMVEHISKSIFKVDGTPNVNGHVKPFTYHRF